ncbi:tetratricopeptide repeat protein [Granulicella tundricola]|uniref:Tetratricopeptide repeat n=1 Tax=Granulicella tundricola (strain ATCC BAA-1859 / DSM 23138 / MP5ACTX9) TaxID=1198114 RepID=E8X682_GRATM|nr:tetratricopeptide repeat protein [Granulicella tundricola]ADW70966.1 Tetratricopeptide repeat [Granulicella tundricola MP5ACTX9]
MALDSTTIAPPATLDKRKLLLRDSITFLTLALIALVLYGVTTLLFHSFESHREDLGKRWSQRGEQAIQQGRPAEAIIDLRAALTYAPDDEPYQLLLAQALANDGRTDEATAYYEAFHEAHPGDGNINLQLARLARKKGTAHEAIDFYRASIFGAWQGDAITRRREVRLELAAYLIDQHELPLARAELLIAAGNTPDTAASDLTLAEMFEQSGDPDNAYTYYRKYGARPEPRRRH